MKKIIATFIILPAIILLLLSSSVYAQDEQEKPKLKPLAGYVEAFVFVRDAIGFEAYSGSLKNSSTLRLHGKGNSLDRAILLREMLTEKGYECRIVYGRLRGNNLGKVIALSLGASVISQEPPFEIDAQLQQTLTDDLSDHYWVQIGSEPNWFNLDPTLPDSQPGTTIAQFRKQLGAIPSYLFQRLEISVYAEFSIGTRQARTRLLRFTSPAKNLISQPITLMFLDRDINGRYKYSEDNRFTPVLLVNNKIHSALNLQLEANRMALASGGSVPQLTIHRLWVDFIIKISGQPDSKSTRQLYSEDSPRTSRLNELTVVTLLLQPPRSEQLAYWKSRLEAASAEFAQLTAPSFPNVLSESERERTGRLLSEHQFLGYALGNLLNHYITAMEGCLDQTFATTTYTVKPKLFAFSIDPVNSRVRSDILLYQPRQYSQPGLELNRIAAAFAQGVAASALEGHILGLMIAGNEQPAIDAVEMTRRAQAQEVQWVALDNNNLLLLDDYPIERETKRRLEESVIAGKVIITTQTGDVWWELDSNGMILGMIEPGIGGAELNYGVQETEWQGLAAAYAPGLVSGWPNKLSSWAGSLAGLMKGYINTSSLSRQEEMGQSINLVFNVVKSAISKSDGLELSPALNQFFRTSGDRTISGLPNSICFAKASGETQD